jgi:hypothetical protein
VSSNGAFEDAGQYIYENKSVLHSLELNDHRTISDDLSFLYGLRYVKFDDKVRLVSNDTIPVTNPTWVGTAETKSSNDLIGLQVGFNYEHHYSSDFTGTLSGKAGIFANYHDYHDRISDPGGEAAVSPITITASDNGWNGAGVIELGAFGNWRTGRNWTLRAGYNAVWVTGLALAAEQQHHASAKHNGDILFHGPSIGVVGYW